MDPFLMLLIGVAAMFLFRRMFGGNRWTRNGPTLNSILGKNKVASGNNNGQQVSEFSSGLRRQHAYVTRVVDQYVAIERARKRCEDVPEIAREFFRRAWMVQNGREMDSMADHTMAEIDRANRRYQESKEEPRFMIPPWFVTYCAVWKKEHKDEIAALHIQ